MELTDRGRLCWHAWAGTFRYACTLPLDHGGDEHEDHATDAPSVTVWTRPELLPSHPVGGVFVPA